MEKDLVFDLDQALQYRWSGKFVGKESAWKHMERQLVDYELIVMEKGTLYIEDEWGHYEVSEGQYLLMEPTKLQRGYKPSKCRFYWLHFLPGTSKQASVQENPVSVSIRVPKQGKLPNCDRLFVLLKQLQDTDLRYMDPVYNGYLTTAILSELADQQKGSLPSGEEEFHRKVDEYLLDHMGDPLSVGGLAEAFGYHEKYFSALFKEKMGQSVKKYVDGRKIERAKYLLLNTDALVAEIADHLGFENVQNFYHVFRNMTNCTPTEFRDGYNRKQEFDV